MKLTYKRFGRIATLVRYRRVAVEGDSVVVSCDGAVRLKLYSERDKVNYSYGLEGGEAAVPIKTLEGGVSVTLEFGDGNAWGTPLELRQVGGTLYAVGGEFSRREEIERLNDALIYAVEVAEAAQVEAARVPELEKKIAALEKRADSGDIINF